MMFFLTVLLTLVSCNSLPASERLWDFCPKTSKCLCRTYKESGYVDMNCTSLVDEAIPEPPLSYRGGKYRLNLTLNDNNLTHFGPDTFRNIPNDSLISILHFGNIFQTIANDTFSAFNQLKKVVFGNNNASVRQLANMVKSLQHTPVNDLTISSSKIRFFPSDFFTPLSNHTELKLSLVNNRLAAFNATVFESLKGLVYLNLRNNRISKTVLPAGVRLNLKRLRLEDNRLDDFPNFCYNGTSYFPQLINLDVSFNHITLLLPQRYECLHSLQVLRLSGNLLSTLKKFQFTNLASLETLLLSYMCKLRNVHPEALYSKTLKKLFFRKNYVEFERDSKTISLSIFGKCPSLELLNINFNVLSFIHNERFNQVFQNLTSLKTLIMGGCGLKFIPNAIAFNLKGLITLVLHHNEIKEIPPSLRSLQNLTRLYLSNNEITTVTEKSLPPNLLRNKRALILLMNNPFSCSCESLWLVQTVRRQGYKFKSRERPKQYRCHSPANYYGLPLWEAPLSEQKCLLTKTYLNMILASSSLLITLLSTISLLYYYRWNLMYFLFLLRHKKKPPATVVHWEYDAYVAYNVEDISWVKGNLINVLEEKDNLKLCIQHRDFEVGKGIVDNMVDCVEKSRKIIIVLSNKFAQTSWCQFELDLVLRHVIEHDEHMLVVVVLEEIDQCHVSKSMRVMLKKTMYLEWGEEEQVARAFFNRLRMLVKRPMISKKGRKLSV